MSAPRWSPSLRTAARVLAAGCALMGGALLGGALPAQPAAPATYADLLALAASADTKRLFVAGRVTAIVTGAGCTQPFTALQWGELGRRGLLPGQLEALQKKCGIAPPGLGEVLDDAQFVLVEAGGFRMGSAQFENERPVRPVRITRPFRMQKTEVTQAQWQQVMGGNPSRYRDCGPTCPVENVTWEDATEFIRRLNERDPGKGYRLPTEAEWEYAARAGSTGDYAGTGVVDDMGWTLENSPGRPSPAARKRANAWGLYDMHGNVWEWVRDWWDPTAYARMPDADPQGPTKGETHPLRGGSWRRPAVFARSPHRNTATVFTNGDIGLRLARNP